MKKHDIVEKWLAERPEGTARSYRISINQFFKFVCRPIEHIDKRAVESFRNSLSKYKPRTINVRLSAVKSFFRFCVAEGILNQEPSREVSCLPTPRVDANRYVDAETYEKILSCSKCDRDRFLFELLYESGCRISELLGLKWQEIKETSDGRYLLLVYGKRQKFRVVFLKKSFSSRIEEVRRHSKSTFVFDSRKGITLGGFLCIGAMRRIVRLQCRRAGVTASAHYLRHSHATDSFNSGESPFRLMERLGHSTLKETQDYLHCLGNNRMTGIGLPGY